MMHDSVHSKQLLRQAKARFILSSHRASLHATLRRVHMELEIPFLVSTQKMLGLLMPH